MRRGCATARSPGPRAALSRSLPPRIAGPAMLFEGIAHTLSARPGRKGGCSLLHLAVHAAGLAYLFINLLLQYWPMLPFAFVRAASHQPSLLFFFSPPHFSSNSPPERGKKNKNTNILLKKEEETSENQPWRMRNFHGQVQSREVNMPWIRTFLRHSLAWKSNIRDLGFGDSSVPPSSPGPFWARLCRRLGDRGPPGPLPPHSELLGAAECQQPLQAGSVLICSTLA